GADRTGHRHGLRPRGVPLRGGGGDAGAAFAQPHLAPGAGRGAGRTPGRGCAAGHGRGPLMELLVASLIGTLSAAGVYLILRRRSFAVVLGTAMLSYAINLFLVSTGRLAVSMPPLLGGQVPGQAGYTDPRPQALVLTAFVIGFGMSAVTLMMALGAFVA